MCTDLSVLAHALFANSRPELGLSLKKGDVLVCNSIFGIGSSREQAPQALRAAGVYGVIAPEFGTIFYRNAWNSGLFAVVGDCSRISDKVRGVLSLELGTLDTGASTFKFCPPKPMFLNLLASGGLLPHIAKHGRFAI